MNNLARGRAFDAQNLAAAEVVLRDPDAHGGDDALIVRWARAVERRLPNLQNNPRSERCGRVFDPTFDTRRGATKSTVPKTGTTTCLNMS